MIDRKKRGYWILKFFLTSVLLFCTLIIAAKWISPALPCIRVFASPGAAPEQTSAAEPSQGAAPEQTEPSQGAAPEQTEPSQEAAPEQTEPSQGAAPEQTSAAKPLQEATPEQMEPSWMENPAQPSPGAGNSWGKIEKKHPIIVLSSLLGLSVAVIAVLLVYICILRNRKAAAKGKKAQSGSDKESDTYMEKEELSGAVTAQRSGNRISVGKLHDIGARPYQEDSFGVTDLDDGVLAIVADGMGGLSGGDKISQTIVLAMLSYANHLKTGQMDGVLSEMVSGANREVNSILGPDGLYKSGSTLLAALVREGRFHWITVGDSHLYFYHRGGLTLLNQEHNLGQELLRKAVRGEISFEEARNERKKGGLTSFIGMGNLKYIDRSVKSIPLESGDRILLMTDGVFNALSDQQIAQTLESFPNVQSAANEMGRLVSLYAHPKQDNYTAVILGI